MEHCEPELLALRALGEDVDPADGAHLDACASCQAEVQQLAALVGTARAAGGARPLEPPPVGVWERVAAEALGPAGPRTAEAAAAGAAGAGGGAATAGGGDGPQVAGSAGTAVPRRRRLRVPLLVAAAVAAGVVIGASATALLTGDRDGEVLASARLDPLPERSAAGTARVVRTDEGRELAVEVADLPNADGFYEVWLLDPEATQLVSVGVLDGPSGRFTLPPGLDLADYPVVDVSIEPFDGDPAHSSDSVVRGALSG